jgi:hypothetical protein
MKRDVNTFCQVSPTSGEMALKQRAYGTPHNIHTANTADMDLISFGIYLYAETGPPHSVI